MGTTVPASILLEATSVHAKKGILILGVVSAKVSEKWFFFSFS